MIAWSIYYMCAVILASGRSTIDLEEILDGMWIYAA